MTNNPERLSQPWHQAAEAAVKELGIWPNRTVHIFHHNDADGLCSGAILTRVFERAGYDVRRFCLEKPYPAVMRKVYEQAGEIFVFADFAGRMAPMLSTLNKGRNLTLILDHHVAEEATDPRVFNLDPDLFGLKGDRDISASTTCYHFGLKLDPSNRDLAAVAALGAVGDEFFVEGKLVSENRVVAMESVRQGKIAIQEHKGGERYFWRVSQDDMPCDVLAAYLDTLGGVGYYGGGPQMGVRVCLEGLSPDSDRMVEDLRHTKDQAFDTEISRLKGGGLKHSAHIQWFHVENRFSPMGVKMIGAFCDVIKNSDFVDPDKYVAGFQIIPEEIPGFGTFEFNEVKISMRVSARMEEAIRGGHAVGLDVLLPEATSRLGGFSDACHSLTAATTVGLGQEERLIDEMEDILAR